MNYRNISMLPFMENVIIRSAVEIMEMSVFKNYQKVTCSTLHLKIVFVRTMPLKSFTDPYLIQVDLQLSLAHILFHKSHQCQWSHQSHQRQI